MKTRKVWIVLIVVAGLVLAACTPTSTPDIPADTPGMSLDDMSWLLETLNGQPLVPDTQPTLNLTDGVLNGTDGCNQYSGTYTSQGGKITVDENIVATMMACSEPVMEQASAYLAALVQAASYQVTGQQLALLDADGNILATLARQSQELSGTSWIVTGYHNGQQAVVSVLAGSTLTLDLGAEGKLGGSAGCNNYSAAYEVSGTSLQIGPAASTRKMCAEPAGVMEQEAQFLQALETVAAWSMDGDRLELRTADGALAVTGVRAPAAE